MPYIFVRHFYASACVVGAFVCQVMWAPAGKVAAMLTGAGVIMLLRFLAAHFRWNLPRVPDMNAPGMNSSNMDAPEKNNADGEARR